MTGAGEPERVEVILAHGYWESRFGADSAVPGRSIIINGCPREIVGVMPPELRFPRFDPANWLPFRFDRASVYVGNFSFQALARLEPDATIDTANADVARMIPLVTEKFPRGMSRAMVEDARFGPLVRPLMRDVRNVL